MSTRVRRISRILSSDGCLTGTVFSVSLRSLEAKMIQKTPVHNPNFCPTGADPGQLIYLIFCLNIQPANALINNQLIKLALNAP